jgi:glutathione S-transferase
MRRQGMGELMHERLVLPDRLSSNGGTPMTPTITAFARSPDGGQGLARDMRVRWALEEAGRPYEVELLSFAQMKEVRHLARHPFGQIPTYEHGGLVLFESGAIVLHIASDCPELLPVDPLARARTIGWMFAALNTVEPPIVEREQAFYYAKGKSWRGELLGLLDERVETRLGELARRLGDAEWIDGPFSAADLLLVTVLRRCEAAALKDFASLTAYVARGESRPAYARAFAAQRKVALAGMGR